MPVFTSCSKCNRAIRPEDVDAKGRCCYCQPAEPTTPVATTKVPAVSDTKQ